MTPHKINKFILGMIGVGAITIAIIGGILGWFK